MNKLQSMVSQVNWAECTPALATLAGALILSTISLVNATSYGLSKSVIKGTLSVPIQIIIRLILIIVGVTLVWAICKYGGKHGHTMAWVVAISYIVGSSIIVSAEMSGIAINSLFDNDSMGYRLTDTPKTVGVNNGDFMTRLNSN